MEKFDFAGEYFNPQAVLECGQVFRFKKHKQGYLAFSGDKACYIYADGNKTCVLSDDSNYFWNYFDLDRDYSEIVEKVKSYNIPLLSDSIEKSKGLRILNQNREETLYSFIISQNNNIPRIKGIIEKICVGLGEKRVFDGEEYYSFPTSKKLATADREFFKGCGAGYRDIFLAETSKRIAAEGFSLDGNSPDLRDKLISSKGVGPKVADCVALFAFHNAAAFPVDTWIEKIYLEDFNGTPASREKITKYFTGLFGEYSGYVQQYLFYAKRDNL